MSATCGDPSSSLSIVRVRVPGEVNTSARKIFPKFFTSITCCFASTPPNFVSIFSTREQSATFRSSSSPIIFPDRSEEHTSELQSHVNLVCRLLLEKKKQK